jgi:hypothetical protein
MAGRMEGHGRSLFSLATLFPKVANVPWRAVVF